MSKQQCGRQSQEKRATAARASRRGFTIIELLVVMIIIGVLAALLFPAFARARESGRQAQCMSNLHQLGLAVQLYQGDEKRYPARLGELTEPTLVTAAGGEGRNNEGKPDQIPVPDAPSGPDSLFEGGDTTTVQGSGYLRSNDVLFCPNDDTETEYALPRSSYGNLLVGHSVDPDYHGVVWNFFGYDDEGRELSRADEAQAAAMNERTLLVNPDAHYDARSNPIRMSLSNRFAPADTIITHCRYHRLPTSNLRDPQAIYAAQSAAAGARDAILRLDGSARVLDVSDFKRSDRWQNQALR